MMTPTRFLVVYQKVDVPILWHGAEGINSKEKYKQLTQTERSQLLAFINSL